MTSHEQIKTCHSTDVPASAYILWFTGLSGAGKSTLSSAVAPIIAKESKVEILDGDEVRTHLSAGLTFSKEDRDTNVRRIGFVARLLAKHGVIAITAAISPYKSTREEVRANSRAQGIRFIEVFVNCTIETLAIRDVKGLYRRAIAGEIANFTGVNDPYEPPDHAEIIVNSATQTREESIAIVLDYLRAEGLIGQSAIDRV
jgi:adenylyl-sulfate kinase